MAATTPVTSAPVQTKLYPTLPTPSAPSAPLPQRIIVEVVQPAIQGSIVLLPADQQALTNIRAVELTFVLAGHATALATVFVVPFVVESFVATMLGGVILTLIFYTMAFGFSVHANEIKKYERPNSLQEIKTAAQKMNLAQLIGEHGLERLAEYNILTPQERLDKWTEWKQSPLSWNIQLNCSASQLLKHGFITKEEYQTWDTYYSERNEALKNGDSIGQIRLSEKLYSDIGWKVNPAPRQEFLKKIAFMSCERVVKEFDLWDLATQKFAITSDEYAKLIGFKTWVETLQPLNNPLEMAKVQLHFETFKQSLLLPPAEVPGAAK